MFCSLSSLLLYLWYYWRRPQIADSALTSCFGCCWPRSYQTICNYISRQSKAEVFELHEEAPNPLHNNVPITSVCWAQSNKATTPTASTCANHRWNKNNLCGLFVTEHALVLTAKHILYEAMAGYVCIGILLCPNTGHWQNCLHWTSWSH